MHALILYFVCSHIISFLCSIFEAVLLSCTHSYVALLKKRGSKAAPLLDKLKSNIDRPLAAILTLNTFSHTIGAAGVGASVVELYGDKWLALASIILTITMLYWTEMLPKTVGALYWKKLAPICARPMQWLIYLTLPFVVTFNLFARFLTKGKTREKVTEEDILVALEIGAKAGAIEEAEQEMVENIFRLGDRRVGLLMSPRVDIDWLDLEDPIEEIRDKILASAHHRFPLCKGDIDDVKGIVHAQDLLERAWRGEAIDLKSVALTPLFVNENQHVFELLDQFKEHHVTLAMVTDEYGSIQGMITSGDVMNAIVRDVEEEAQTQLGQIGTEAWVLEGSYPIDEFKENFHFESLPDEEKARYRTLSGLCMHQLGAIPKRGNVFEIGEYRFEILKVRQRRVEKVLLNKIYA